MMWEDEPEYYDPPGGLLRYDPDVPAALVSPAGGMTADGHVALMEHQLSQLAIGLALAIALGRKLILPPLTCGYDKAWYALDRSGAFGGAPRWVVPIKHCPLDHVLEPDSIRAGVVVREYSLLSNLRMPAHVLASAETTSVDVTKSATELNRLRDGYSSTKVLTISNVPALAAAGKNALWREVANPAKGGVLGESARARIEHEVYSASGGWCCKPNGDRGPTNHPFRLNLFPPGGMLARDGVGEGGGVEEETGTDEPVESYRGRFDV